MENGKMIAVVGMGAILPDASDVTSFWKNIESSRYSITDIPADRWKQELYYDPDPFAPDKTYTKIGAFVQDYKFEPFKFGIAIPPKVLATMDTVQQWAIAASHQALTDYGYPARKLDPERVAVIFGNSNAGDSHYRSNFRILLPEFLDILGSVPGFGGLSPAVKTAIFQEMTAEIQSRILPITEDTMPGELSNIISGRVANVFNFSGPNFITDAACASSLAALQAAIEGLLSGKFDTAVTGGIDHSMSPESYIKFCKIGALSPDGSRPYADGANGFVMGEGAVVFLLKRLADAERDGDKIYAVIRGIGGSSDGKGKGITAPNPLGQKRAIERAWRDAGINPISVGLVEGHGTSTKVGDVAEVSSLSMVFGSLGMKPGSVALGSVKSNIGHLKSAAGAVGLLKTILSLHNRVLPPSVNFERPNPNIDFSNLPFKVNTQSREWSVPEGNFRFAGVSSFGFGGTNFHVVLEEYFPGVAGKESVSVSVPLNIQQVTAQVSVPVENGVSSPVPSMVQSADQEMVKQYVLATVSEKTGYPVEMLDLDLDLEADLGIDTVKQAELLAMIRTHFSIPRREDLRLSDYNTLAKVIAFICEGLNSGSLAPEQQGTSPAVINSSDQAAVVIGSSDNSELRPYQGLFFTSADSVNNLIKSVENTFQKVSAGALVESRCPSKEELRRTERIAIDYADQSELVKRLEKTLAGLKTENSGTWKALQAHGIYRGSGTPGKVAFLFPGQGSQYVNMFLDMRDSEPVVKDTFDEADRIMTPILGKPLTSFIYTDGSDEELQQAEKELKNTQITQPAMLTANVAVMRVLQKYGVVPDMVIGHSLGEYAALVAAGVLTFDEALRVVSARGREMSKVQMEDKGCMAAVSAPLEKVTEVINSIKEYVVLANINSPVQCVLGGSTKGIDEAIAKFQAEGLQAVKIPVSHAFHTKIVAPASGPLREVVSGMNVQSPMLPVVANVTGEFYPSSAECIPDLLATQVASPVQFVKGMQTLYENGARVFIECGPKRVLSSLAADNLKDLEEVTIIPTNHPRKGGKSSFNEALCGMYAAGIPRDQVASGPVINLNTPIQVEISTPVYASIDLQQETGITGSVVISGAGLGLPGKNGRVFDDGNMDSILNGDMRIETLSEEVRQSMLEKHVTRLVKSDAGAVMEEITDLDQVLKLAGQGGEFDLQEEFGVPEERVETLDVSTQLAIAAGIEALRDAGIPLVMQYKKTTTGSLLPKSMKLPTSLQDETGVIFCSAFPGLDRMADEADRFYENKILEKQTEEIQETINLLGSLCPDGQTQLRDELDRRKYELEQKKKALDYSFDRRFVFRVLSMGHSQFAEYIGARGPNTHVNAACASTTHAVSIAEDWIRAGRCRRVIVVAGDDITNPTLISWIGSSMFASGAATIEGDLRMAALPFDRRRNGMIMGMGAAALVIESEDSVRERGMRGIGEILSSNISNSAFHGTRLDVTHVSEVMERLLKTAEQRFGFCRQDIAAKTVFVSHETYTPARGGSASAEIHALRSCFGDQANQLVIANTKGFTGHTMGVGVEDVVAVKALETGKVPPIAHIGEGFEPDPELGDLNLSKGGEYDPEFSLRLGAGFGSQIAMTLVHKIPGQKERVDQEKYNSWLSNVTGYGQPEQEIVKRTLRIKSLNAPEKTPAASTWVYGQGPTMWAAWKIDGASRSAAVTQPEISVGKPVETMISVNGAKPVQPVITPVAAPVFAGQDDEAVKSHLLALVSEKTGYPMEMLDLDLDLEADLGIDTVKQAELFAAARTYYGIPRREDLILADYNTLRKVVGFMQENVNQASPVKSEEVPEKVETKVDMESEVRLPEPQEVPLSANSEEIKAHVLSVVSEKTGYPVEMLDLDLDLEADLGIDTVKQAELFAAVRTYYGIPRREDLILADYNTLAKVIGFIESSLANIAESKVKSETTETETESKVEEAVPTLKENDDPEVKRRVPVPALFPRLDLCLPTGITLEGSRVVVVKDGGKVSASLIKELGFMKAQVLETTLADAQTNLAAWGKEGEVNGVYFLPGLDSNPDWEKCTPADWSKFLDQRLEALYHIGRALPEKAFFIGATRMGGLQGISHTVNPLGGGISGFLKALRRERPDSLVKTVDFAVKASPANISSSLVAETLSDPDTGEIGHQGDLRFGVVLQPGREMETASGVSLEGSIFVVSGGAGGITAAVVRDLAANTRGRFYLLGRTRLTSRDDPDLAKMGHDRNLFKQDLQVRMAQDGAKVTPVQVENKLAELDRIQAVYDLIDGVVKEGGNAEYLQCDVTDPEAVAAAVQKISAADERVDVFIHAAGIEKSRKIETKSIEEFKQTVSIKADGFLHVFRALEAAKRQPKSVVFFSSVAGRFGNAGQTDYSAGNDLLSKYASWLPVKYPKMQTVSIDWGAWAEVGMASRGSIPRMMEHFGIEMINPRSAAPMVYRELTGGWSGEVVIAGSLGQMESLEIERCGFDFPKADEALRQDGSMHKMFSHLVGCNRVDGIRLEATLNPDELPYLHDHAINGVPVLPGVIGIQGFSTAAKHVASVLASGKKGFVVKRLEDIQFLAPFKFYDNKPRTIIWNALPVLDGDDLVVKVTLESDIRRVDGRIDHTLHFTGMVYLSENQPVEKFESNPPKWGKKKAVSAEDIYKLYFHGPSFQVLEAAQSSHSNVLGRLNKRLLMDASGKPGSMSTPLLIELCFQTAGLWEAGATGTLALPASVGKLSVYPRPMNGVPIYAEVKPRECEGNLAFDARVLDSTGNVFVEVEDYRTSPLPFPAEECQVEPMKVLVTGRDQNCG